MPAPCPSEEDLLALATGDSSGPRHGQTLAHLEICTDCRALVSELLRDNVGQNPTEFSEDEAPAPARGWHDALRPGQLIADKFRLERVLGEGGMGIVMLAEHVLLEERVALKFMHHKVAAHPDAVTRFLREARASSKIKSEHVARVLDVGTHDGMPYLVMEYLEGSDLAAVLARDGRLPLERAIDYVLQACEALARAHERGLVHRDLKPANIFLAERDGSTPLIKVLDFGIAKAIGSSDVPSMTASNAFLGSPRYMAPEQVQNARDVDARADIWALGAILFELLSGRPAFDQPSVAALLVSICTQPPPALRDLRSDVPASLSRVVADCLRVDPRERPSSVTELVARLRGEDPPTRARKRPLHVAWLAVPFVAVGFLLGYRGLAPTVRRAPPSTLARASFAALDVPPAAPVVPALLASAPTPVPAEPSRTPAKPSKPAVKSADAKGGMYDQRR